MVRDDEAQGFPREVRLRHRREYQTLWSKGRRFHTPHFIVLVLERTHPLPARLGLTVSRKVGNAVVRNRVKRGLRDLFRRQRLNMAAVDISIVARAGAGELDSLTVRHELDQVFLRFTRQEKLP